MKIFNCFFSTKKKKKERKKWYKEHIKRNFPGKGVPCYLCCNITVVLSRIIEVEENEDETFQLFFFKNSKEKKKMERNGRKNISRQIFLVKVFHITYIAM